MRREWKQPEEATEDSADSLVKGMERISINDGNTPSKASNKERPQVEWQDFEYALSTIRPSQQIAFDSTIPPKRWSEIGGYDELKKRIEQSVNWPLMYPETYKQLGVDPPSGLLLYGPSGCGKTSLVRAVATESFSNVIPVKGPEIFSKYLGETEQTIRRLFATARQIAPCVIFFDEMNSIAAKREWEGDGTSGVGERILSTLLNEMDGIQELRGVFVIGCTNRPDQIDDALLRPGRIDQLLYVGPPTRDDRESILRVLAAKVPLSREVDFCDLAERTTEFTGADLEVLLRESAMLALRQDVNTHTIDACHVEAVLEQMAPIVARRAADGLDRVHEEFRERRML